MQPSSSTIPVQRLKEILSYDPLSGNIHVNKSSRLLLPDEFGMVTVYDGTAKIKRKIKPDKLAWMLFHSKELEKDQRVLHKNLDPEDNSAKNLVALPKEDYSKVLEALNNLESYLKVTLHSNDQYKYVVHYRDKGVDRKETFDGIETARERYEEIRKKLVVFVNKYIVTV